MRSRRIMKMLAFLTVILALTAWAAEPFFAFEGSSSQSLSPAFQAWHTDHEDDGDYGESWFFLVRCRDGGVLFALMSITNLGLSTYDGTFEVDYYAPDGKKYNLHREVSRDQVKAATDKMDLTIAKARAWGGGGAYHLKVDDPDAKLNLDISNIVPSYRFGDGSVRFYAAKTDHWTLGLHTPCGKSTGSLTIGGRSVDLAGFAYHDHAWANIKVPTFISRWSTLRILENDFALVLHDQLLSKSFGSAHNLFGVVGLDGKIAAATRNFSLQPKAWKTADSGYKVPTEVAVSIQSGGYKVSGTVKDDRYLASVDVLGQVSWPIRMAIKAFYTNPYFHRQLGKYDLEVTDKEGKVRKFQGTAVLETNYF